jgi:hypothetical protein
MGLKHLEVDPIRIEVRDKLLQVRRRFSMSCFRIGVYRRILDAEAATQDAVNAHDVDLMLEQSAKRAADAWKMVGILDRDGDDSAGTRANAEWWTSIHERWVARGGPENHVAMLRNQSQMIRGHVASHGHEWSECSRSAWLEVAADKELRANNLESAFDKQEAEGSAA